MQRSSNEQLTWVEIGPQGPARASVVWLHGLGADGHDFEPVVPYLGLPEDAGVRFIFPNAPQRPVTINGGMRMPAWYDIAVPDLSSRVDSEGIRHAAGLIAGVIDQEKQRGIPSANIVLAGFSQGGVVAMHLGLRYAEPLAGILALSCYLTEPDRLAAEMAELAKHTPLLMMHGKQDEVVPYELGVQSRRAIQSCGVEVAWRDYPMGHSVSGEQIVEIGQWLKRVLNLSPD